MLTPLPRSFIRLLDGPLLRQQALNTQYLLSLDPDRLLHSFRVQAGLPSSAAPYGGWEHPDCGLRGHFVGHYVAACAMGSSATGDAALRERAERIVEGLAECQAAMGTGYLSAFPMTEFDRLEREFGGAWAPYYTLHKILAGLIVAHREAGIPNALPTAVRLGAWVARRMAAVPPEHLEPLLSTKEPNPLNEFGGIGESLYDLWALTGNADFLHTARVFDRDSFLAPLMQERDELTGLHTNTHIPQVLAAARRYELTGEPSYRRAAEFFWSRTALARSFANGGSSGPRPGGGEKSPGAEHWPPPFEQGRYLSPKINESCVSHNMLRLTDRLFSWDPRFEYAEFRERTFTNSVMSMQHPHRIGGYLYHHPLTPQSRKEFGKPEGDFWCCYGTCVEAFASPADGVYYTQPEALWVTQFVPSRAVWRERGVSVEVRTDLPEHGAVTLSVSSPTPTEFTLSVRIPGWTRGATCRVLGNGEACAIPISAPGGFLHLRRRWSDGDRLQLDFPMSLRFEPLPGGEGRLAFFRGPQLLAARSDAPLDLAALPSADCDCIREQQDQTTIRLADGSEVPLVPIRSIADEPFGAYFRPTPDAARS
jgi:DUF1680 family protein